MSSEWAIRVSNLSKTYRVYDRPHDRARQWIVPPIQKAFHRTPTQYYREVHALEDVSFEINRGRHSALSDEMDRENPHCCS